MAHDPSLGFADYFSAADATAASVATLMPTVEDGAPELFGLHADMEFLGMRGLAAMPGAASAAAHSHSKAVLIDAGPDGGSTNATMRFLSAGQQQQHHQPSQAPLSLSLCRPDGVGVTLHQHLGGSSRQQQPAPGAWMMHDYSAPQGQHAGAWQLRCSRFLLPAQELLQEFCSLLVDASANKHAKAATTKPSSQQQPEDGGDGSSPSASRAPSPQIRAMDALELQRLKDKLYIMLEEVDRRYRRYCEQMRALSGGFEAVAGERAAAAYTALASRTISRHFRNLRDGILAQLQAVRNALGEKDVAVPGMTRGETPRLRVLEQCIRQQKAFNQAGMMESHPWRPQRGLPERAVTILRAWLFEHFLHPYPSDVDKHILARQTGLSRSQVSNWFINARVRLWKPMVEEMYVEEMKDGQDGGSSGGQQSLNPNPSCSHASEAHGGGGHGVDETDGGDNGDDRKPTREQLLHDAGSLASIVNIGGVARAGAAKGARLENFGLMDHLDFDAYDGQQGGFGGAGGVSLTLGLQQHDSHDGGVNIAFGAPQSEHHGGAAGYLFTAGEQMVEGGAVHPGHGHHVQFGAASIDGEAAHGPQEHYRGLSAGFHLLRDLAG
ncbi:homeobox protein BEL1 homolog [Phragmites australis]|uniref:homeobox protein BEL1 homolog n=1 Tax=Phragmites australis TaxID=29695 RepID=UPI002D798CCD|nr:homeobox protein BEL1 homolog [Phragmites australis]XP_062209688.1 homeobox protein BEL1 homolog [Phragmites australis]